MTREEAIHCLTSLVEVRKKYAVMQTMQDEAQCLEMAIEALKQEPCNDCISRKAAIDCVTYDEEYTVECLTALPSVAPLPNNVLDKIRAEIVDLGQRTMNDNRASGIWACRDIIDKYKAESGAQDADNN